MTPSMRLALNTISQYVRTVANVLLLLFATRLVLSALGSNDYGVYTLVAGVVSMLTFITNSLTSTTQRYLSYNFGKSNVVILQGYFSSSVIIHLLLGLILVIIMISSVPLLFNGFLNIDIKSIHSAKMVYLTLIGMLFIALMTSPFRAVLIAHENIIYISIIDIVDGILKLVIGYVLSCFDTERLIWYGILMASISVFNILAFGIYCIINYQECRKLQLKFVSKTKIKELTSFAVWTIYGTLCIFGRSQGLAIVLNKFFNTIINAAYGISLQVNSAIGSVAGALQTAISPQVIKAEGENNRALMLKLSELSCKVSFILLSYVSLPVIFDINNILTLWLGAVPEYTGYFCIVMLTANLFDQLTVGFNLTMNATGKIRNFILTINTLKLLTTVIVALLLYWGIPLLLAFSSYVLIEVIGCVLRVWFCKRNVGLNVKQYCANVLIKLSIPEVALLLYYYIFSTNNFSAGGFIIKFIIGSIIYTVLILSFSLTKPEKDKIFHLFRRNR